MPVRSFLVASVAVVLMLIPGAGFVSAEIKAELVSTKKIWDRAPRNIAADLVRFKGRWFLVCRESTEVHSQDGAVRVLTSEDAAKWESVALIQSPTPNKGLSNPGLTLAPNGELMVTALGVVPNPAATVPVPQFGGTVKTMAWFSRDGRTWSKPELIGPEHFPFSRVVWNKDLALSYASGCICGSLQTVQFFSSKDGKRFTSQFKQSFSGFFPEDAALIFDGDTAYCLMSRVNSAPDNAWQPGLLGTARAPYTDWTWKDLDTRISYPNLIRLPDNRIIVALGLIDRKPRTTLCEFDLATGKLTEFLEIPTAGEVMNVGLVMHDGHLWVSYHAAHEGKMSIHLAKVKLK